MQVYKTHMVTEGSAMFHEMDPIDRSQILLWLVRGGCATAGGGE